MTRLDFAKGWLFLTAQPWGKAYRDTGQMRVGVEPSPADLQAELYYNAFSGIQAEHWKHACQIQATGDYWPSIATLRQCLHGLTPPTPVPATWGNTYITKEHFGLTLFEVVHTISSLHTLRQQLNRAVHQQDGPAMTDRTARYKEAQAYLANQLPTLTDHEMAQVLEKYPNVVAM